MRRRDKETIIVVGNDHYNTLNVVRALGTAGYNVEVLIISDSRKSFVLKSRFVGEGRIVGEESLCEALLNKADRNGIKIPVIPTYDGAAVLLDMRYDDLSEFFILPSSGRRQGELTRLMDKELQTAIARNVGMTVPFSMPLNLASTDWEYALEKVVYPCIVKPRESYMASKDQFRVCRNMAELRDTLQSLRNEVNEILVQEFISNDEVILIGGVRTPEGRNFTFGEINKEKHSSSPNNMGLCCLGYWTPKSSLNSLCEKLVTAMDYFGCYSVEFIRNGNQPSKDYFIEINLRTDGLFYFFTKAGINYPAIWADSCYGFQSAVVPAKGKIYGMNEFLYLKNALSPASPRDFIKTKVFSIMSLKDPKPFIYKCLNKL